MMGIPIARTAINPSSLTSATASLNFQRRNPMVLSLTLR